MNSSDLASLLNGRQYNSEITNQEINTAKKNRLVVIYGYSDDNMSFNGSINTEASSYKGTTVYVLKHGRVVETDEYRELKRFKYRPKNKIEAVRFDEHLKVAWSYKTKIPHHTFNIYREGVVYCIGIVFSLDDLK